MHRMARFEKVSEEQFYADLEKQSGLCESVRDLQLYEQIPIAATGNCRIGWL